MERPLQRCLLMVAIAIVALAGIGIGQSASAASCFVDGAGGATNGPLYSQFWLALDYINDSQWGGDNGYYAQRRFSSGGLSYNVFVSSGNHSYGTSGNAYRRTTIDNAGDVNYDWYETEWQIC